MFKFIHAADIHLDSPLINLDQYDGAPVESLRVATRDAFDNLINLAIVEQVKFLIIGGDLYDQDSPDFNTPRHVRDKFRELQQHNISVYIIQGNHDAASKTKRSFAALTFPENVHVFSTRKPETLLVDEFDIAIHGQGFPTRSVEEDLSADYPPAKHGAFNIGILHTNVGGNVAHSNYAPSTIDGLRAKEYQYWALGHIHKRTEFAGGPRQQIRYSGNTQGRHIGEQGAKGCLVVSVNESQQISVKFHATDVWRWQQCEVDVTGIAHAEDAIDAVRTAIEKALKDSDDRSLAVRVVLKGATEADRNLRNCRDQWRSELHRMTVDAFEDRVWIEKFRVETQFPVTHTQAERNEAYGELVASIFEVVPGDEVFASVREDLEKVLKLIPNDSRLQDFGIDLDDEATVAQLVDDAKQLLAARLLDTTEIAEADGGVA